MRRWLGIACSLYSWLLVLYPRSLRDRYGAEMRGVLREQLTDRGSCGAAARAFVEPFTIGLPARVRSEVPAAAPLALCASSAVFYGLLFVLHDSAPLDAFMRKWLGVHCP
ncbi:MAG TPA: hypothetical protein VFB63_04560 [Bryobacteraceae bacterium]|nr:hypothetical protein [Bryobacteraceae bacterium]